MYQFSRALRAAEPTAGDVTGPGNGRASILGGVPATAEPPPAGATLGAGSTGPPAARHGRPTGPIAVGAVLFVIGLVAVAVIMVLFATGAHDLPLWLNLTAMLAPVGFGVGLYGIAREARAGRAERAARAAARDARAATGERNGTA